MFLFWSISDNSEAQHFIYFHFYVPFSGTIIHVGISSVDLLRSILFGAFQMHLYCWSSAVRISYSRRDLRFLLTLRVDQLFRWSWIMIPICWMLLVSWWIFSNNRGRPFRSRPLDLFELFGFFLIDPADSVYFCAFVLFWLEIRLITIVSICFW